MMIKQIKIHTMLPRITETVYYGQNLSTIKIYYLHHHDTTASQNVQYLCIASAWFVIYKIHWSTLWLCTLTETHPIIFDLRIKHTSICIFRNTESNSISNKTERYKVNDI